MKYINGISKNAVVDHVANVYDITVSDQHEFFANNVLVHNCSDTFDYILCQAFQREFTNYQRGGKTVQMISSKMVRRVR